MGECWDRKVWEELGGLFEKGLDGVVEASEVGVGGAGHGEGVDGEYFRQ